MGFAISWFAIPMRNSAAFFARFDLSLTGEKSDVPDYSISTANLDTGWTLLWYNKYDCPFLGDRELAEVSRDSDVLKCLVDEHVMASSAAFWSNGTRKWFLSHEGENGPKGLNSAGALPEVFHTIKREMESLQLAEGGDDAEVDYIFEIPLLVAKSVAGFKHDENCSHMPDGTFHAMTQKEKANGFLARLFGGR